MKSKFRQFVFVVLLGWIFAFSGMLGCGGGNPPDLLTTPSIVAIDSLLNRVFVIDNANNRLNLIDPLTNKVVTVGDNQPLLSDEDPQLLPLFPSNAAVASMQNGVSRIFVIGANATPSQQITVLDYDPVNGLRLSSISPITVPGNSGDVLVGIAVDPVRGLVIVSDSTAGTLYGFNISNGGMAANFPVSIGGNPTQLAVDLKTNLLAVANSGNTLVSFLSLSNLANPPSTLNVGIFSRSVALATNASGTALFVSGSLENVAQVYLLKLNDLGTSNLLSEISPPAPTDPVPDPLLLTGNLNFVTAGNLSDGRMAGFYTQSSGDVLAVDLTQNLTTLVPTIITIGAATGEGIAGYFDNQEQLNSVYFASPGIGAVTVVNPLTNEFGDQIP